MQVDALVSYSPMDRTCPGDYQESILDIHSHKWAGGTVITHANIGNTSIQLYYEAWSGH